MTRALAFLVALFLAFPSLAAPAIDQAGADALKPRLNAALQGFGETLKAAGVSLTYTGDVMVEPAGTYYAITTPSLQLDLKGLRRTVGMIAINAIPTADPNAYKVAVAMPTPMVDQDAQGKSVGSVSIGEQAMNGIFRLDLNAFTELSGSYKNLRIVDQARNMEIVLPQITTSTKLTETSPGLWSGPSETVIANASFKSRAGSYRAANITLKSTVQGLDMKAHADLQEQMKAQNASLNDIIIAYVHRFADSLSSSLVANDIAFTRATPAGPKNGVIKIVTLNSDSSGLKGGNAAVNWDFAAEGIGVDDPVLANFTPRRLAIKGSGAGLDIASLTQSLNPLKAMKSVKIDSLAIDAPSYGVDASGALTNDAQAFYGASGSLKMSVRGIDELMTWMTGPNGPQSLGMPVFPPAVMGALTVVQMSGVQGADAGGRPTRGYDLQVAPDGKITLNGADLSGAMKAASNAAAGSTSATVPVGPQFAPQTTRPTPPAAPRSTP